MFVPLRDGVPIRRIAAPHAVYAIIGLCSASWLLFGAGLIGGGGEAAAIAFGTIPVVLFGKASLPASLAVVPEYATLVTSLFMHVGLLHLAGNMLFLWVFGDNVEDAMGHVRFTLFYLACGVGAGLAHAAMYPDSADPLIGASGAVSGVVVAYLLLYPNVRVFGLFLSWLPLTLPATWAIGLWIVFQFGAALFGGTEAVAWWAHVGGMAAGVLLVRPFLAPGVRLFNDGPLRSG